MSVRSSVRALRGPIVVLLVVAGLLGAVALWSGLLNRSDPERAWVREYGAWVHSVMLLVEGRKPMLGACREFGAVADPPVDLAQPAERVHDACVELAVRRTDVAVTEWYEAEWALRRRLFWHGSLPRRGGIVEGSRIEPRLSVLSSDLSGRKVEVRCWSEADWPDVQQAWQAFTGRPDFWLNGIAEWPINRVQLGPAVCRPLARLVYSSFAPWGNEQIYWLAEAVATLAHEARHIKHPGESEAVVECYALQDMRGLVMSLGRPRRYANELVGLAVELSYPRLPPEYQTEQCREGGPLDLTPRDDVWP